MKLFNRLGGSIKNTFGRLVIFIAMLFHKIFEATIREAIKAINEAEITTKQQSAEVKDLLVRLIQKPIMPMLMNLSGQAVNLANERGIKVEARYNPIIETLDCTLYIDHRQFDIWKLRLDTFNEKDERKAIFDLGRVLLKKRQEGLTDQIQFMILNQLVVAAQYQERVNHFDLFNVIVHSYIEAIRPYYEKEKAGIAAKAIEGTKDVASNKDDSAEKPSALRLVTLDKEETVPEKTADKETVTIN